MPLSVFMDAPRHRAGKMPSHKDHGPFLHDGFDDSLYGIEPLRILVSPLADDAQGLAARHVHDRLAGRLSVSISVAERPLTVPDADYNQPLFVAMAVDLGRRWLQREGADLLVWGESISTASV